MIRQRIIALLMCVLLPSTLAAGTAAPCCDARVETLHFDAPGIDADGLRVRVFLPPGYDPDAPVAYPVLYVDDGQDAEAVALQSWLDALTISGEIRPLIAVAIDMPHDRLGAYGFSDRAAARSVVADTRAGPVGANAHAYAQWLAQALVPAIDARYRTRPHPDARAILGWSLGGAQALDSGWQYPEVFGRIGAFSPSLWLATDRRDADALQRTRIAQGMIARGAGPPALHAFFAVGDAEETDDRDGDGVIDVLDDARDLIDGWRVAGEAAPRMNGLHQLGHTIDLDHAAASSHADVALYVLPGGVHRQPSWSRMLPVFLRWAYAADAPPLHATGRVDSRRGAPPRCVAARILAR